MYKTICGMVIILIAGGCVSEPAKFRPSAREVIKYGDYYLQQQPPDGPRALRLYERAAAQSSNQMAQFKAAELLNYGKYGVVQDKAKALEYYKLSSAGGNSWATYNLASAYSYGSGVTKNRDEALRLANLAYSQSKKVNGYLNILLYDLLKESNRPEAERYLVEAANVGFKKAQDMALEKGLAVGGGK